MAQQKQNKIKQKQKTKQTKTTGKESSDLIRTLTETKKAMSLPQVFTEACLYIPALEF